MSVGRQPALRGGALLVLVAAAIAAAGCGGGSSSTSSSRASTGEGHATTSEPERPVRKAQVLVTYEQPQSRQDALGLRLIRLARTKYVATQMASTFQLPRRLAVQGVDGLGGGPFYDPGENSITFPYGFSSLVFDFLKSSGDLRGRELGVAFGSVQTFLLAHEFGHALIHNFDLPVLGKEEDAADAIATILLLKAPKGGLYATDAAHFWADFSGRQNPPAIADYADIHSLDLQRAFNILCQVAGSTRSNFERVAALGVLPRSRLQTCPAEYRQVIDSLGQELEPHVRGNINLEAAG